MTAPLLPPPSWKTGKRPYKRTSAAAFIDEEPDDDDLLLAFAPYIHVAPRGNSITPERQRAFIAALAATGIVTQAARKIGASLEALYRLRHRVGAEGFAAAWEEALDRGVARLEDCALERAIQGQERVLVNRKGEVVVRWTQHDTSLITFFLRQRRTSRFASPTDYSALRPGHPVYDRLRKQWNEEHRASLPDMEEVRAEILRKLDALARAHAQREAWEAERNENGETEIPE